MRFGRNAGTTERRNVRGYRALWSVMFVALFCAIAVATFAITFTPANMVASWIEESFLPESRNAGPIKNDPEPTVSAFSLASFEKLGEERQLLDPVLRNRRMAEIEAAAETGYETNAAALTAAMNAKIDAVNEKLAEEGEGPLSGPTRIQWKVRINNHRNEANEIMADYHRRVEQTRDLITEEKTRRLEIVRGLREPE